MQWYKSSSVKLPGKEKKYRNGESLLYYCMKRGIFLPFLTVLRVFKIRFFFNLKWSLPFWFFFRLYKCALLSIHSLSLIQWSHSLLYTRSIVETVQVYAQQCVYTVSLWYNLDTNCKCRRCFWAKLYDDGLISLKQML